MFFVVIFFFVSWVLFRCAVIFEKSSNVFFTKKKGGKSVETESNVETSVGWKTSTGELENFDRKTPPSRAGNLRRLTWNRSGDHREELWTPIQNKRRRR
jgi:hypothetical protein